MGVGKSRGTKAVCLNERFVSPGLYEVPLGMCVVVPVMLAGSMDLVTIAEKQAGWFWNWNMFGGGGVQNLPLALVAGLDLLFLAFLIFILGREIVAGRNWRNLKVLLVLVVVLPVLLVTWWLELISRARPPIRESLPGAAAQQHHDAGRRRAGASDAPARGEAREPRPSTPQRHRREP